MLPVPKYPPVIQCTEMQLLTQKPPKEGIKAIKLFKDEKDNCPNDIQA